MQWHATKLAPGSVLHAMACDQACQGASCMHRHVTKPARERPACGGHVAKLAAGVGPPGAAAVAPVMCVHKGHGSAARSARGLGGEAARVRRDVALHIAGRPA